MKLEKMNYLWIMLLLIGLLQLNSLLCWSLNYEGIALLKFREKVVNDPFGALSNWKENIEESNHCSWSGIECVDGHVVSLKLKNLCLKGTLAPELHHLSRIKSIILRNNSFSGFIPEVIKDMKELEVLDLGYNNFSGPLLPEFGHNIPILLLDNNGLFCQVPPELEELMMLSEVQVDENHLTNAVEVLPHSRRIGWAKDAAHPRKRQERLLRTVTDSPVSSPIFQAPAEGRSNSDNLPPPTPFDFPNIGNRSPPPALEQVPPPPPRQPPPPPQLPSPVPSSTSGTLSPSSIATSSPPSTVKRKTKNVITIVVGVVGGFVGLVLVIGVYLWRSNKITTVRPWATGLSGQLQRALVAGIPNLKRSELETACEDFSNVIGSSSIGTIYKGTLSSGVEIAVISLAMTSAKDWSRNLESLFRKKIEALSKMNHKNFVNLIGYCEEEKPFTRMMVFEYVPNGSLFEHLHIREAEHLDWGMRLRVMMGMAYCLEHMHQLVSPITHPNLNSSAVNLSEDYAAKISDFCFWNEVCAAQIHPTGLTTLYTSSTSAESNVYSYALVILEMMTGRIPHSVENNSIADWVSDYLIGDQPLQELVDPMLRHFDPQQLESISEVLRKCLHPEPQQRPTMRDITARFREITGIDRDKAIPRLSPMWWAELEIRSMNGT